MSVGKSVYLVIGVLFLTIMLVGCEGDPGSTGPVGIDGPDGPPGNNFVPDPIATQFFGLIITNSTATDFNGAARIEVTSDLTAVSGPDRVTARLLTKAPRLDGVDGGTAEWDAAQASAIPLSALSGNDNGVGAATVRFAYDRNYVYALVSWTETESGGFAAGADTLKNRWTYSDSAWTRAGGEDRLYIAWEITDIVGWETNGMGTIFNEGEFAAPNDGDAADLWMWQSTETYYANRVADMIVKSAAQGSLTADVGTALSIENLPFENHPSYMRSNSLKIGSPSPLLAFEYVAFDTTKTWTEGATIPGYVTFLPSGSVSDVQSVAKFSNGTWTVEVRRARNTGHADDRQF